VRGNDARIPIATDAPSPGSLFPFLPTGNGHIIEMTLMRVSRCFGIGHTG